MSAHSTYRSVSWKDIPAPPSSRRLISFCQEHCPDLDQLLTASHGQTPAESCPSACPVSSAPFRSLSEAENSPILLQLLEKSEGNLNSPQTVLLFKRNDREREPGTSVVSDAFAQTLGDEAGPVVFVWRFQTLSGEHVPSLVNPARGRLIDGIWLVHMQPLRSFKTKLLQRIFKLGMSLGNKMFPSPTVFSGVKRTNSKDEK